MDCHRNPKPSLASGLLAIAQRVLDAGHGGTIVIVPMDGPATDKIDYRFPLAHAQGEWPLAARGRVEERSRFLAQLCAVDGALVLNSELGLLGFGGVLPMQPEATDPSVYVIDPKDVTPAAQQTRLFSQLGLGTRHRSAVDFCHRFSGTMALIVSHDGDLSFVTRPTKEKHAVLIRPFYPGTRGLNISR